MVDSFNTIGDILPDFRDLDSDDDTIPDTIEAYPTDNYDTLYANDGDVRDNDNDSDGVIDIFDANDGTL